MRNPVKLAHIELNVPDLEKSENFYIEFGNYFEVAYHPE